ncbi:MAG: protein kinase [Chthonomonadales bacterium]
MSGKLIGDRFEVLERLGEGAIFSVVKCRDNATGRIVALKSLEPAFSSSSELKAEFQSRLTSVLGMEHPHIARLEEIVMDGSNPVLVVEFVRGMNLKERIRRIAPFTLSVAVDFSIAIAEALQVAHSRGVIHGDLRPNNVIASPEGAVKVTDFGIASCLAVSPEAAGANLVRAIPYQAPEISQGTSPTVPSDLYSLGVILYEMLTGSLPFTGETPVVIAMKHQQSPAPSPKIVNPGVPRSLEGIVLKLLQKDPYQRYVDASFLLVDLKLVREALRFGKSLSWSPLDNDPVPMTPAPYEPEVVAVTPRPIAPDPGINIPPERSGGEFKMSRPIGRDDSLSPFLKLAIGFVVFVLLSIIIGGVAVWMAMLTQPPEQSFPRLVGMKLEDARSAAEKAGLRLMEHDEFSDKFDRNQIIRTEPDLTGRSVHAGRSINIWVSKGSKLVYVPEVVNLQKEVAETKLKEAGMTLGTVDRAYDTRVAFDFVISQNPRPRKRVNRDLQVGLVISDGPKPDGSPEPGKANKPDATNGDSGNSTDGNNPGGNTDSNKTDGTSTDNSGQSPRSFTLSKKVPADGKGSRRVRMEFEDALGTHTAVDEVHGEGDKIVAKVTVVGTRITVRVFYGEDPKPVSETTQALPGGRQ